jgi:YggT family protein
MGGSIAGLIVSLFVLVIDIYIIMLFIRLFISEYERYDAVLDMVFQATDPIVVPLTTSLRTRTAQAVQIVPLLLIVVLLLLKGMFVGSIPGALQGFLGTLVRIYVLTIIVTAAFREAYLNPIVNFGQRMVRPIRQMARYLAPQPAAVNVLSVGILIVLHTVALLVLYSIAGQGGDDLLLVKRALIYTLRLIVDLTWFFVLVLFLYVILSWFSPDPHNPLVQLLTTIALPILEPLRRVVPPIAGVMDISPIIAMFVLQLVNAALHGVLDYL